MQHMVIYRSSEGKPSYHQSDELDAAVKFVERLRNDEQISDARIFRMDEVAIAIKTYYRVELAEPAPAAPAQPSAPAEGAPAQTEAKADEAKAGRAKGEPAKADGADTDAGNTDAANTDATKIDAAKTDAANTDAAAAEPATEEPAGGTTGEMTGPTPVAAGSGGRFGLFSRT